MCVCVYICTYTPLQILCCMHIYTSSSTVLKFLHGKHVCMCMCTYTHLQVLCWSSCMEGVEHVRCCQKNKYTYVCVNMSIYVSCMEKGKHWWTRPLLHVYIYLDAYMHVCKTHALQSICRESWHEYMSSCGNGIHVSANWSHQGIQEGTLLQPVIAGFPVAKEKRSCGGDKTAQKAYGGGKEGRVLACASTYHLHPQSWISHCLRGAESTRSHHRPGKYALKKTHRDKQNHACVRFDTNGASPMWFCESQGSTVVLLVFSKCTDSTHLVADDDPAIVWCACVSCTVVQRTHVE